ncbi:hypothetical protein N7532_002223 [Penicillium argentinense]|uniref:Uncharacterized protein n=1 Tax=Penicillium argentinense TaxID=1131581 RepID=A0A9W9G083_9EURO|nr:uncharacterized protein N7532_002223 [Penicillium argentinense]KAJ5109578.1 hypothetical protein N7532_002223 [Penicillium argentinense]
MPVKSAIGYLHDRVGHFNLKAHSQRLEGWLAAMAEQRRIEAQTTWIKKYEQETRNGRRIVQREMNVSAELFHLDTDEETKTKAGTMARQHKIAELNWKLKVLADDFIQHTKRLDTLKKERPRGSMVREYLKKQKSKQPQPQALWKLERYLCQLRGGCCTRDCGCCELSWRTIRDHSKRIHYLHCRGQSCACCARNRMSPEMSLEDDAAEDVQEPAASESLGLDEVEVAEFHSGECILALAQGMIMY